jgi:F0F1-type ATP synthase assembly protein I
VANKSWQVMVAEATSMVFLLPISTVVGYGIGYLLDKAFGTHWLYIPFLALGAVAGLVQLIRQLSRDSRDA